MAVNGEIEQPDFEAALRIFFQTILPANKEQKRSMQEASAGWKAVKKDNRVHVGGFRLAMKIADMEEADQQSFLRALHNGLKLRKVVLHADLVDGAEGNDTSNVIPIEQARGDARSDLDVPDVDDEEDEFDVAAPSQVAAE